MIGDSASSIADDKSRGASSYKSALENVIRNSGKRGKTRQEAFANLDIQ